MEEELIVKMITLMILMNPEVEPDQRVLKILKARREVQNQKEANLSNQRDQ
jgi:hypothetical protein